MQNNQKCEVPAEKPDIKEIRRGIPVMIYDGDCGFCKRWVDKWQRITGDKIQYMPYQFFQIEENGFLKNCPQISVKDCQRSVQLIMPDGQRHQTARAVFESLYYAGKQKGWLWFYKYFPGFKFISEIVYKFVAHQRGKMF